MDIFKKMALASIGAAEMTKEKLEAFVDEMIKRGEMSEDEKAAAVKKFVEKSEESASTARKKIEEMFSACAEKCSAVFTDKFKNLGEKIDDLSARVEHLEKRKSKA